MTCICIHQLIDPFNDCQPGFSLVARLIQLVHACTHFAAVYYVHVRVTNVSCIYGCLMDTYIHGLFKTNFLAIPFGISKASYVCVVFVLKNIFSHITLKHVAIVEACGNRNIHTYIIPYGFLFSDVRLCRLSMQFAKYKITNYNFVHIDGCDHIGSDHVCVHFIEK